MTQAEIHLNQERMLVKGVLDFSTVAQLRVKGAAIIDSLEKPIIDLKDVTRCNSAALVLLIAWLRDAKEMQKKLRFENLPKELIEVAMVTGLKSIIV